MTTLSVDELKPLHNVTTRLAKSIRFVTAALLTLSLASIGVSLVHPAAIFLGLGALALVAVVWPLHRLRDATEILSPWTFVILSVFVGVGIRSAYLTFGWADHPVLDTLFLLGHTPEFFFVPGALLVFSLFLISLAYFSVPSHRIRPARLTRWVSRQEIHPTRLHIVVLGLAALSFAAFLLFAQQTGGLDLLEPSRKRAVSPGLEVDAEYRGFGYLRFLASLAATGYLALLSYYASSRRRIGFGRTVFLASIFLCACFLPFYASARSEIIWLVLMSGVVVLYGGRRLRSRDIFIGLTAVLLVFQIMGLLRAERHIDAVLDDVSWVAEGVDSVVLNRNLVDITRTAHVIDALPGTLDFKYGQTLTAWLLAPVPRELWPEKPIIQAGPEVGVLVYGMPRAGVPPGFVAEMYWNFHVPGVVIGSLLLGLGLRALHVKFNPRWTRSPGLILVYAVLVAPTGMIILGGTVGQGLFNAAINTAQALGILWLSGMRHRRSLRTASHM